MKKDYLKPAVSAMTMCAMQVVCASGTPSPAPARNSAGYLIKDGEQNVW